MKWLEVTVDDSFVNLWRPIWETGRPVQDGTAKKCTSQRTNRNPVRQCSAKVSRNFDEQSILPKHPTVLTAKFYSDKTYEKTVLSHPYIIKFC